MSAAPTRRRPFLAPLTVITLLLGACGGAANDGPLRVDVIGKAQELAAPVKHASSAAGQFVLGATAQGLVAFNETGEVVSGLAERWIVEENGRSYIFRLKPALWPDGKPVKAAEVARLLRTRMDANPMLLAGLKPEVRGMTDEVVEIRIQAPMPSFLQILAQPAMAVAKQTGGTGPFGKTDADQQLTFQVLAPPSPTNEEGDSETTGESSTTTDRPVYVRAVRPALGFARFKAGQSDLLLGGRFQDLPYFTVAALPTPMILADPVNGLFGLSVEGDAPFLSNPDVREIFSMAIDRDAMAERLNLSGWQTRFTILPSALELGRPPTPVSWAENPLEARRGYARSVVANWRQRHGEPPRLRIALPDGPGATILYALLAQDLARVGLSATRVAWDAPADLRLIDEVAPFDSALWYLARVSCAFHKPCSEEATERLAAARAAPNDRAMTAALDQAERLTLAAHVYIPIGMPVRFSLVRGRLAGFQPSPRAIHPLVPLLLHKSE